MEALNIFSGLYPENEERLRKIMASQDDMLSQAGGINENLAKIAATLQNRFALSAFTGSFVLTATPALNVADTNVKAASVVLLQAMNAAAGTLMGSTRALYISARSAGASFQVATASGAAAAGGEAFAYVIVNTG